MIDQKVPNIVIKKIALERIKDIHEMFVESSKEWFANGMLPKLDFSVEELEQAIINFIEMWENDTYYLFTILDASNNQIVGYVFLNHVNRTHQLANLGYQVRTSRQGEGMATAAAKLGVKYGFEKLGFQRIEIVTFRENIPSQKVAEKLGAVREGLQRNRVQVHGSAHDAYIYSLIPSDFGIDNTA